LKEPVVVDSTSLIGLEQIGRLDLLPNLFQPVYAPPEVQRESGFFSDWLRVETPTNLNLISALKVMVDDGEAEAIALAAERSWKIVLDDRRARDVAQRMELKIIGTVGILVRAKREGLLHWIKPLLNELTDKGFHLSEDLKREALRLVGE
jgi:predicted nucleic acid-binding protein